MNKILIIEDDENIAELEKDYLLLNGFTADVESDGNLGLKKALNGDYNLVLVDLMHPGLDGVTIVKRIRELLEIPILVVSARGENIDKIRGLGAGADDYMTKPFSPDELVARVRSHISRFERLTGNKQVSDVIRIRGLEIHCDAMRVLVNNREVTLTSTEYALLHFMASNPGIVFSRERLFETVWGQDSTGDTATVAVHIQKIRKKIEKNPAEPEYIETIWGTGYRFNGFNK